MKYFTKDWYKLMQNMHYTEGFEPIEAEEFTDEDIKKLYEQKLGEWIETEKEAYEEKPDYSEIYEILENKVFNPSEWLFVDEKNKQVVEPVAKQ